MEKEMATYSNMLAFSINRGATLHGITKTQRFLLRESKVEIYLFKKERCYSEKLSPQFVF